jgi:hypothetical protein
MTGKLSAVAALALLAVAPARAEDIAAWQERLFSALASQGVISGATQLVSANYVCTLIIGGDAWSVVNTIEYVRGAEAPRAHNQIVVLDRNLKLVRNFDYADQTPLFCRGASLFLHGDYGVDNAAPYGNTLTFTRDLNIKVSHTDVNALPIESTSQRRAYLLK